MTRIETIRAEHERLMARATAAYDKADAQEDENKKAEAIREWRFYVEALESWRKQYGWELQQATK